MSALRLQGGGPTGCLLLQGIARAVLTALILTGPIDHLPAAEASPGIRREMWRWRAGLDEGVAYLAFAIPDSDIRDIEIACDVGSGDTRIRPNIPLSPGMNGLRVALHLVSPGGEISVTARADWNDVLLRIDLEAQASAAAVVRLLSRPDLMIVGAAGREIAIPLGPGLPDALATFRRACPGAG